jgi:cell division protein FtsB
MLYKLSGFRKSYDVKSYMFSTVLILCFFYGFYQLFSDRGVFTLYRVHKELEQQKQENELLKQRQKYLESRVEKLEENSVNFDYDYLDEIIRDKLGVIKKTEKVIYVEE